MKRSAPWLFALTVIGGIAARESAVAAEKMPVADPVDFVRDIKPIFETHCTSCHGTKKRKGDLRLDTKQAAMTGGLSGAVLVPGKGAESLLTKRIRGAGDDERMPEDAPPLPAAQIALIQRWIDQGAVWPDDGVAGKAEASPVHWAYAKPARPAVPAVKAKAWVRNPIDAFVAARLEKERLRPAPEADRETLLRRVTLDLTGLPPTLAEVDAFKADGAKDAYEKVVSRLLASRHYGERWARLWLDLARYADSNGYEKDRPRIAWKYRDWVIDALNSNMSFKQFTVEQIAGDMLPSPTLAQRIATGFHRNTLLNQEGGIDIEEARWETLVDRVGTTGTVWLGSTIACSQCHNHKYDPFSQKDFYRLLAFWDNGPYDTGGSGVDRWIVEPTLYLPNGDQRKKREAHEAELAGLREQLKVTSDAQLAAYAAWERSVREAAGEWVPVSVDRAESKGGARLTIGKDGTVLASGTNPDSDEYQIEATTKLSGITGIRIEVLPHASLPGGGPGRHKDGNFFLTGFHVRASTIGDEGEGEPLKFKIAVGDESSGGSSKAENLISEAADDGWAIDPSITPRPAKRQAVLVLDKPVGKKDGMRLTIRLVHKMPRQTRNLGYFRLSVTGASDPTLAAVVPTRLKPVLGIALERRAEQQRKELHDLYGKVAAELHPVRRRIDEVKKAIDNLGIQSTLIMEERPGYQRPSTHLRLRGSFLSKGELTYAGTPKILPPLPESQAPNRLGLAHWLVDDDNPLTARVTVNRFWAEYFGHGIVDTTEDFGSQGTPPSHPELLDWMATELMRTGWDMKAFHKLVVTSATYRQSSRATPELLEKDLGNRLFARGPRFRLDAEAVRDVALHVSGLLSRKIGGPSVFPTQPEGIWNVPYSSEKWVTSTGEDRHRRGLYTFIRRSAPYPSMLAFDAPSREACTPRRIRTNTPLQALVTLNDPAFFEAAQGLGVRLMSDLPAAADAKARAIHGLRLATGRSPRPDEVEPVVSFYRQQKRRYSQDPGAAQKLVGAFRARGSAQDPAALAELAAWTTVGNVLLNLDETVTKE